MGAAGRSLFMGLIGALGATLGGVAGEALFPDGPARAARVPRSVCLVLDVSGSMARVVTDPRGGPLRTQLEALKQAAAGFVERQDLSIDDAALVVFSTEPRTPSPLTHDAERLQRAIRLVQAGGTTDMAGGLEAAGAALAGASGQRWVLLFTDGKPEGMSPGGDPVAAAVSAGERLRGSGVNIVAIGTALADVALLGRVTGRSDLVLSADFAALDDAFRRSEEVIRNRQMLASVTGGAAFRDSVAQAGAWAALIAIGAGLALVVGQNRHMRRRLFRVSQIAMVIAGGIVTGLLAGTAGQSLYYVVAGLPEALAHGGRIVAWLVLGGGAGLGMSAYVPNLDRKRALAGGLVGGAVAGACFLGVAPAVGDMASRLLGAATLGLATGLMLVLVEYVQRRAWLVVRWSRNETSTLRLGRTPIVVGAGREAHISPSFDDPVRVRARISLVDDQVRLEEPATGERRVLHDGETLTFDRITVQVRIATGGATPPEVAADRERAAAAVPAAPPRRGPGRAGSRKPAQAAGAGWYQEERSGR